MEFLAVLVFFIRTSGALAPFEYEQESPSYSPPVQLVSQMNLPGSIWISKKVITSEVTESARALASEARSDSMGTDQITLQRANYYMFAWRRGNLAAVAISQVKHPVRQVALMMSEVFRDVTEKARISKYNLDEIRTDQSLIQENEKNYLQFENKLMKVSDQLIELKDLLHETVQGVLDRGDKLKDLVDKTDQLRVNSEIFRRRAKKLNQKCPCLGF